MTHAQRLLELLSDGKPHSHHETYRLGIMAHSRAADLRKQGHDVRVWREGGSYWYQIALSEGVTGSRSLVDSPYAESGDRDNNPAPSENATDPGGVLGDDLPRPPSPREGDGAAASPSQLSLEIPSRYKRESEAA